MGRPAWAAKALSSAVPPAEAQARTSCAAVSQGGRGRHEAPTTSNRSGPTTPQRAPAKNQAQQAEKGAQPGGKCVGEAPTHTRAAWAAAVRHSPGSWATAGTASRPRCTSHVAAFHTTVTGSMSTAGAGGGRRRAEQGALSQNDLSQNGLSQNGTAEGARPSRLSLRG